MTAEKLAAETSRLFMCVGDTEKWELPVITTARGGVLLFNSVIAEV